MNAVHSFHSDVFSDDRMHFNLQGFWRNWHASFNLWLVRYMYVPLGGSAWRAANVWPIFTFVALWHDLEWRLLAWAWLSCGLIAPELVSASSHPHCNIHQFSM